ncbi:MAG: hypothetical protein JXX28_11450 [Deltaproteobacteria bacterium]|nr:hypothetical protein [Deltaproteobacteria bacterium]
MILLTLIFAALAGPPQPVALGFAAEVGSKDFRGVSAPAMDLFTLEARVLLSPSTSVDLRADWTQLFYSSVLTSSPRLPLLALYHRRAPLGSRFALGYAGGLDLALGRDAVVVDEQLAHIAGGRLAVSGKLGVERRGRRDRSSWGLSLRTSRGIAYTLGAPALYRRTVLEFTLHRRVYTPTPCDSSWVPWGGDR